MARSQIRKLRKSAMLPFHRRLFCTSDYLHRVIKEEGFEIDAFRERPPIGLITVSLVKFVEEPKNFQPAYHELIDVSGTTLQEALLYGLIKIRRGV